MSRVKMGGRRSKESDDSDSEDCVGDGPMAFENLGTATNPNIVQRQRAYSSCTGLRNAHKTKYSTHNVAISPDVLMYYITNFFEFKATVESVAFFTSVRSILQCCSNLRVPGTWTELLLRHSFKAQAKYGINSLLRIMEIGSLFF